ncbi:hypothetical protein GCM10023215_01370 [Pseudonocardia yuanmonensis]|uniref:Uncharacterized protein n=1 Tax=Pseudonocardia yuanmonensis TaxID=1095914 RepID=A0ABP8VW72_9PSEU
MARILRRRNHRRTGEVSNAHREIEGGGQRSEEPEPSEKQYTDGQASARAGRGGVVMIVPQMMRLAGGPPASRRWESVRGWR